MRIFNILKNRFTMAEFPENQIREEVQKMNENYNSKKKNKNMLSIYIAEMDMKGVK